MKRLKSKTTLIVFILVSLFLFAQAGWWYIFMERLVNERVDLATELGASQELIENIYSEETAQKRMVMVEGSFFILIIFVGVWLVFRAFLKQNELQKQQQNFIMAVSHELKTPLASMSVYLDGLQSSEISQEKKERMIPSMRNDITRLRKLVDNILSAAKMKRTDKKSRFETFDLSRLVKDRVQILANGIGSAGVKVTTSVGNDIKFIGDKEFLGRAIDSLLENSVIHNKGRQIEVTVRLYKEEKDITLEIADNGIGIESDELNNIFDQFYRVGSELTRTAEGTGLGLYITSETIKSHGGTITAQSDGHSDGVKFVIKLRGTG